MESVPVVLLLSAVGGALTFGVMVLGVDVAERTNDLMVSSQGFSAFVERVTLLCSGGPGSSIACRLDVGDGVVRVVGKRLRLLLDGKEIRSASVPVPFDGSVRELVSGEYVLTLQRGTHGEEIKVSSGG